MTEKMTFNKKMAEEYDKGIRRTFPSYDTMLRLVQSFLRANCNTQARLLLVGAGGGNELTALGPSNPDWTFTAVDPAASMLELARMKAEDAQVADRVEFVEGTVDDVKSRMYDAATCLLVLHFIRDDADKLHLLKKIRQHLPKGAPFVLAAMYGDEHSPEFKQLLRLWKAYWLDSTSLSQAEVDEMEKTVTSLSFLPEEKILGLLDEAGFTNIAKFLTTNMFGGWICQAR